MCAIAGVLSKKGDSPLSTENIIKTMSHRGPDGHGSWSDSSSDLQVSLYHSRLAILDLSEDAKQPFQSKTENTVLTYNGEIYNYKELKEQFSLPSKTTSDTEILVEIFERKNISALHFLDGMFAFGAYSKNKKELVLAVDPAGKKPIYTYWDGKTFAFASEIKILKAMGLPIEISREHEMNYLFFGYIPSPATYYKNIRKLPAGHYQVVSNGVPAKIQKYFYLPTQLRTIAYADAKNETQSLIQKAVKKRLVSDRPLGAFLSGGLDSSIVSLEASTLTHGPLKTFSISFKTSPHSKQYDESIYAEIVAKKINSLHTTYEMDNDFDHFSKIIQQFDEPYADSSCFPTAQLCKNTSKQVKVVLSGDGGDELYGGYSRFKASLIAEQLNKFKSLNSLVFCAAELFPSYRDKIQRFKNALSEKPIHRLCLWNSFYSFDDIKSFSLQAEEELRHQLHGWDEQLSGLSLQEKILHFNFYHYLFNDLLPKVDRMSMRYGLEVRSPFLDKDLIQSAFTLPSKYKFNQFNSKIILKDLYRNQLTKQIVDRSKKGFGFHLETLVNNPGQFEKANPLYLGRANTISKKFSLIALNEFTSNTRFKDVL
jgi:asparagine synthase (glutamine-hydrolysing)